MNISTTCDSIDSITRIHFLDLLLRFLKFREEVRQSASNAPSRTWGG